MKASAHMKVGCLQVFCAVSFHYLFVSVNYGPQLDLFLTFLYRVVQKRW